MNGSLDHSPYCHKSPREPEARGGLWEHGDGSGGGRPRASLLTATDTHASVTLPHHMHFRCIGKVFLERGVQDFLSHACVMYDF